MTFKPQDSCSKAFTVHTFDVDAGLRATPAALFRCMQEVAILHVERLGFGLSDVAARQQTWVIAQMLLEIKRRPTMHEVVNVQTWSNGVAGQFALRDFSLTDSRGEVVAAASSHWLLLDQAEQKICRISEVFGKVDPSQARFALKRRPTRVKTAQQWSQQQHHIARYSELDFNGHVNHICYIEHALDMVPLDIRKTCELRELALDFLQESNLGDVLNNRLSHGREDGEFIHSIVNENLGRNAFAAHSCWLPPESEQA